MALSEPNCAQLMLRVQILSLVYSVSHVCPVFAIGLVSAEVPCHTRTDITIWWYLVVQPFCEHQLAMMRWCQLPM